MEILSFTALSCFGMILDALNAIGSKTKVAKLKENKDRLQFSSGTVLVVSYACRARTERLFPVPISP